MDILAFILHNPQLTFAIFVIVVLPIFLTIEFISMDLTVFGGLAVISLFYQFFPIIDPQHQNLLGLSQLLSGFASPTLITIISLVILSNGLVETGITNIFVRRLIKIFGKNYHLLIISLFLISLFFSAFINNIPIIVIMIPVLFQIVRRYQLDPMKYLIPLSYVGLLGGMLTLVGSSTNLLVAGMLHRLGVQTFTFFSITSVTMWIVLIGGVYTIFIAPLLIKSNQKHKEDFQLESQSFLIGMVLTKNSIAQGKVFNTLTMQELNLLAPVKIEYVLRDGQFVNFNKVPLSQNDHLFFLVNRNNVRDLLENPNFILYNHERISHDTDTSSRKLLEVMVTPSSDLLESRHYITLLSQLYNATYIGKEYNESEHMGFYLWSDHLSVGDILLLDLDQNAHKNLYNDKSLIPLDWTEESLPDFKKQKRSALIFLLVMVSGISGIVPLSLAAFVGAIAMFFTGVLRISNLRHMLNLGLIGLIVISIALGTIVQYTGLGGMIAQWMATNTLFTGHLFWSIIFFIFIVAMTTNVLSNQVTSLVYTPIGLSLSQIFHIDPHLMGTFIIIGANLAFLTPFSYQTNILVMRAGHYQFKHFLIMGLPLFFLTFGTFMVYVYFNIP